MSKAGEGEIAATLGDGGGADNDIMSAIAVDPTELQSVTTAISVLKQHVTQANVKLSDWKKLQGTIIDNNITIIMSSLCWTASVHAFSINFNRFR